MAPADSGDEGVVESTILLQLSQTRYACSSLSPPLSSRPGNLVFRGHLSRPLQAQGQNATESSVIIKHASKSGPKTFEELLLISLAAYTHPILPAKVHAPRLYLYDQAAGIQILENFSDTTGFRSMLYSPDSSKLLPQSSLYDIGRALGAWLRSFHDWSSAPEQVVLRREMWRNDGMRKVKYAYTYNVIVEVLENYPELLDGCKEIIQAIRASMAEEVERSSSEEWNGFGLIHADLWSGNILLPNTGWRESSSANNPNELFVIDWEFAQYGHRSCDLGQMIGDLLEQKIYRHLDTATSIMEGVLNDYGAVSDETAFRTAVYVGVHLISWYNRRPRAGPRVVPSEMILAGLKIGRNFAVKGWEKDVAFFQDSVLAPLFRRGPHIPTQDHAESY